MSDTISLNIIDNLMNSNCYFSGSYSFENCLILYRDHMGVEPLYYYIKGDTFLYAKDMRELCSNPVVDLELNEKLFYLEFSGANDLTLTETEFKYIHAVRPGSWCEFTKDDYGWSMKEHIYWQPGDNKYKFDTDEEYVAKLRELVEESIRIRADKIDGPIGCEMSGGLDSGVIGILLSRMGYDVRFMSWSLSPDVYPIQPVDERAVIADICKQENKDCKYIKRYDSDVDDIDKRNLPPFVNTLQLSHTAKAFSDEGIKYVFTGHGGDEGVSHRANLLELWHHGEYKAYLHELWVSSRGKNLRVLRFIKNLAYGLLIDYPKRKKSWQNKDRDLRSLFTSEYLARMKNVKFPPLYFNFDPKKYILQGGSRSRMDNCAVQAGEYGVKYSFPFLDYRLVDFALSVPRRLYRHYGQTRWIYREAFKDIMPQSLYDVGYKDFPSLRNFKSDDLKDDDPIEEKVEEPEEKEPFDQNKWADEFMSCIDWSYWDKYFDRSKCEKLLKTPFAELKRDEFIKIKYLDVAFTKCRLIDNMRKIAKHN